MGCLTSAHGMGVGTKPLGMDSLNPIQAGVFWNLYRLGAHCAPSVSPLFVVQLQPNLA